MKTSALGADRNVVMTVALKVAYRVSNGDPAEVLSAFFIF